MDSGIEMDVYHMYFVWFFLDVVFGLKPFCGSAEAKAFIIWLNIFYINCRLNQPRIPLPLP